METSRFEFKNIYGLLRHSGLASLVMITALSFVLGGALITSASAQDEPPTKTEPAPAAEAPAADQETENNKGEGVAEAEAETAPVAEETLESMLDQWKGLEAEMSAIKRDLLSAVDPGVMAELRNSYGEKNDAANLLVGTIENAALEKLSGGDKSTQLFELLTGIVMNHADFERDQTALEIGHKLIDAGIERKYFDAAATADRLLPFAKEVLRELAIRCAEAAADDLPRVKLVTSKGDIVLELFENEAPDTVGNFISLVESDYYDGLTFHRVLENFMAQGGDPKGDGTGGPGYTIYCECYKSDYRRHFPGSLSMAKTAARDTGGSQFFLTFVRTGQLDGKHTVFGRVIDGMDVVNSLQRINPDDRSGLAKPEPDKIISAEVLRKRDHEYVAKKAGGG